MEDVRKADFLEAIQATRERVVWKPGKGIEHVERRVQRGHLPEGSTLERYEEIIKSVVTDPSAMVYTYRWRTSEYPAVVADVDGITWLVMMSLSGVMETAFVVDRPGYLEGPDYTLLGTLGEMES